MVMVIIVPHVYGFNDIYVRYVGLSVDTPLPASFWSQSGYIIGIVGSSCWHTNITRDLPPGTHYVVVGTSADAGGTQDISITLKYGNGVEAGSRALDGITRNRYMYVAFTITQSGTISSITHGVLEPGYPPPVNGVGGGSGGGGGQDTSGGGGVGTDFSQTINQMMQNLLPPMMNIMMMMVMMQMMTGMMAGITSGF